MAGLDVPTDGPLLSLAGFATWTHGFFPTNLGGLRFRAQKRRENLLMPRRSGRRGTEGFRDELAFSLHMKFFGDALHDGTPQDDEYAGVDANLAYFQDVIVDATEDARGTVAAVYTKRGGGTVTRRVQVNGLISGDTEDDDGIYCLAVVSLVFPDGVVV